MALWGLSTYRMGDQQLTQTILDPIHTQRIEDGGPDEKLISEALLDI